MRRIRRADDPPAEWVPAEERRSSQEREQIDEADEARLAEEIARATWRRRVEELDPPGTDRGAQGHGGHTETNLHVIPGPFRSIFMDMLSMINVAQQTGDWKTMERAEKLWWCCPGAYFERHHRQSHMRSPCSASRSSSEENWPNFCTWRHVETPADLQNRRRRHEWESDKGHGGDLLRCGAQCFGHLTNGSGGTKFT